MSDQNGKFQGWREALGCWIQPRVLAMLFLGFSAGIPILLIFSTLSVWLREAGVSRSAVTFFSWAALGYSFKFIWAPLIDLLPVPLLTGMMGRRRSWLLVSQLLVIIAIIWMAVTNPTASSGSLILMALAAVMLGFSSATQDIVIDAYRIESAEKHLQAMLASMYIAGYRLGMLVAGAGSLYLASWLGTSREAYHYEAWRNTYLLIAAVMLVGVLTTMLIAEPESGRKGSRAQYSAGQYGRLLGLFVLMTGGFVAVFFGFGRLTAESIARVQDAWPGIATIIGFSSEAGRFGLALLAAGLTAVIGVKLQMVDRPMVIQAYVQPVQDFFQRYSMKSAILLLLLVGFYRVSDIVLGVVSNVFYVDIGFSNNEIATITKTFGLVMTLAGGFVGGLFTARYGVMRILFVGALLSAATNLLFLWLARSGADLSILTMVIAADNLSAGLASTAFVAFLSALTSISFTAVQYAIFSSAMTLFPKLLGGYSGSMVSALGYEYFFLITAAVGVPVLLLIWLVRGEDGLQLAEKEER